MVQCVQQIVKFANTKVLENAAVWAAFALSLQPCLAVEVYMDMAMLWTLGSDLLALRQASFGFGFSLNPDYKKNQIEVECQRV